MPRTALTRRTVLASLAVLGTAGAVAACTGSSEPEPSEPTPTPAPPDLRTDVADDEAALIALYDVVIAAYPAVSASAAAIREQHAEHLAALGTPSGPAVAPETPTTPDKALRSLVSAERKAMRDRIAATAEADPELARLLTFIGASEGSHVPALRRVTP